MAAAAADLPVYYRHIPAMSDVAIDVPALLAEAGRRIPNFTGFRCRSPPSLTPGRSRRSFGRSGSSSGPDRRRVPTPSCRAARPMGDKPSRGAASSASSTRCRCFFCCGIRRGGAALGRGGALHPTADYRCRRL